VIDEYDLLLDSLSTPKSKGLKTRPTVDFRQLYNDVGAKHGVDPNLLYDQAKHESVNFNPHFVFGPGRSPKGAAGLAQFMPDTARKYGLYVGKGRDDRFNPQKAADAHARLMKDLIGKYGDTKLALAAYNAGTGFTPQQARRAMQRIPETRNYVQQIAPQGDQYDQLLDNVGQQPTAPQAARPKGDEYDDLLDSIAPQQQTLKIPKVTSTVTPLDETPDRYNTSLSADEEAQFQQWKQRYAPKDSGADYDLRGAFKAGLTPDPRTGHWPDTFKKPNHPTFSVESQYATGEDRARAGHWEGDKYIPAQVAASQMPTGSVKPIEFQSASQWRLHPTDVPARAVSGVGDLAMRNLVDEAPKTPEQDLIERRYKTPDSLKLGRAVKVPFPNVAYPSSHDVTQAYLKTLGPEYEKFGEKYHQETGRDILQLTQGDIDRDEQGNVYVQPSSGAIRILNAYVQSGGNIEAAKAEGAKIGQERTGAATEALKLGGQDIAEVQAARKSEGAEGAAGRVITGPTERWIASIGKMVGGLSSLGGLTPNDFSRYMNRKSRITELGASLPPLTPEGKEIQKHLPEKVGTALVDLGYTVFEIAALKKMSGLSAGQVMAIEQALKTSDEPPAKRAVAIAQAYALGKVLDSDLSRTMSASIFAVPAGVEGAQQVAQGNKDWSDVALDVGIQGGFGAIMSRGGGAELPTELGMERAPIAGVPGEATANIDQRLAEREAQVRPATQPEDVPAMRVRGAIPAEPSAPEIQKPTGATYPQTKYPESLGVVGPTKPITVVEEGAKLNRWQHRNFGLVTESTDQSGVTMGKVRVIDEKGDEHIIQRANGRGEGNQIAVPVRKTDSRVADEAAQAAENAPFKIVDKRGRPSEVPQEPTVEPSASAASLEAPASLLSDKDTLGVLGYSDAEIAKMSPSEQASIVQAARSERQGMIDRGEITEPTTLAPPIEEAKPPAPQETSEPPPSTTSARKGQLAQDRAELDLPELPTAERKSWQTSLDNAKAKGLDRQAERTAEQVLEQPRALNDEQTAGMTLRLQQLKNEHASLLDSIAKETDPEQLAQHRADLESVEQSFDKITAAVKASGTEKGRSLASQKLTINQDFDLVSMLNRYKAKTGKEPASEIRAQIESQQKRIADLEKQLAERSAKGGIDRIAREVRRENRQRTRKVLDEEAATIRSNIAAEFARLKSQSTKTTTLSQQGLGLLDPDGVITRNALKYAKNRFEAGVTDAAQLVDDVHSVLSEFADVSKRQVAEMISGYKLPQKPETKEQLEKTLTGLRKEMRDALREADIKAGEISARPEGPRLSEGVGRKEGPKITDAPKVGPKETKAQIQSRYQKQINEIERRIREQDFAPKAKRGPTVLDSDTQKIQVNLERAKQDFQRQLRKWEASQRSRTEKTADLIVQWGRAAKLMYISTLGKLSSAATGRMVMSPLENLIGEIPHRLSPELSKRATTEGGGFDKAAEVAALWKSGRFRQVLDQLTKGGSDLDVLFGGKKSIDKEMSSGGVLGIPGRVHGAMKEYPRQAEFDRAFVKVLRNYDREGRDITRPDVQLAAKMEAFNSAERARFQQRNFISDTFNSAMGYLERKGIAGKATAKAGRFIFPITRVPVNVVGETLNYSFGIPRAAIETAIRGGVKNLTPEQANNIMRAYKKGGIGLAVMAYAFMNPQQFGGYYQKGEKRDPNEPQTGEVMFFGKRIPKVLTHVPILEAAQLAATARRVMDRAAEQGKTDSAVEGGLAATKGLAEQIPFYETPARFFTGQEGSRGVAQATGELARGTIPGFIQEAAKFTDKDAEGKPIPRSPQGSFAQRFGQTIEMGIPGLRSRVPVNEKAQKQARNARLIEDFRSGKITQDDLNAMRDQDVLTKDEAGYDTTNPKTGDVIHHAGTIEQKGSPDRSPTQVSFENAPNDKALERYERLVKLNDPRVYELQDIMAKKAWSLTHSDALTEKQKADFQQRIDALGITPVNPQERKPSSPFSRRFLSAP
jgi:hypothetical protein